ncbi:MAG: hypothetical protein M3O01_10425, partial [Pseudomonadota bacterium]|nr:hypothetical protein [Pseudomonadota bacterium]
AQGTAAPAPPGIGPAPLVADASGAPSPKPAIHAAPKTTQAHPSRPAAPARPQHWAAAQPATAREACGTRTFLSLAMCLDRQCERPRFRSEPSCARMLEARRRRAGDY